MLHEQISKLDCDGCKLRTEHYVLMLDERVVVCRCLKCGQSKAQAEHIIENVQSYPVDNRRPIYVV